MMTLPLLLATTLTLREAVDTAAAQNPAVQMARLEALEAENSAHIARSAYLPQASLVAGANYQTANLQGIGLVFPGFPSRLGPYRTFNARPVVTQTILDASLRAEIRAARERTRAAKYQEAATRQTIQYAALQLDLQALESGTRMDAAAARIRTAEAVSQQVRDREQGGLASKLDVARAAQQLADEEVALAAARRDRDTLLTLLLRTIGREQWREGEDVQLAPVTAAATELSNPGVERDEVRALEASIAAAGYTVDAAARQRWPRIAGQADWGLSGAGPDRAIGTYNAGVAVTIPLWTGKRIENEMARAELRRAQERQRLADLRLEIQQQIRQAQVEAQAARAAHAAAARSAAAARETLELVRLRYGSGLATTLDTTVAQNNLAQAEEQAIRVRYQELLALARLARARGDVGEFLARD
ncbi:MAG: TolC family protein [Bryobacterales bacterium]|nr:TolC family protein [Bryobacterales bacterium]